ncbi:hypothetical protein SANTM175S_03924 [Streptomyces antimycoticus]
MSGDHAMFHAEPTGMLRVPLLPRSATETRAHLDPRDREQVRRYLDALLSDGRVEEALAVSSPSLRRAVEALRAGAPMKAGALRKLTLSATRYVLRGASPHPLRAPRGCRPGVLRRGPPGPARHSAPQGGAPGRRLADRRPHRLGGRPRGAAGAARRGERPGLRTRAALGAPLRVRREGPRRPRGAGRRRTAKRRAERPGDLRTPHGRREDHPRRRPAPLPDRGRRGLDEAYPNVPGSAKEGLLLALVRQGFLLTELRPPLGETDPLRYAVDVLKAVGRADKARELAAVGDLLAEYAAEHLGAGLRRRQTALDAMSRLRADDPVQVDMRLDADVTLDREVLREAERAAMALRSPHPTHSRRRSSGSTVTRSSNATAPAAPCRSPMSSTRTPAWARPPATTIPEASGARRNAVSEANATGPGTSSWPSWPSRQSRRATARWCSTTRRSTGCAAPEHRPRPRWSSAPI